MATPRFDRLCVEFIKRIPDHLRSSFIPGSGQILPDGNLLKAVSISDYINRAMQELFNSYWESTRGDVQKFIGIFPELVKISNAVSLNGGNYTIAAPYKDFYKIVGAVKSSDSKYVKVKDESKYTLYLSQEYEEYKPTSDDPVIIQVNQMLAVFPQNLTGQIKFQYIKVPLDPLTGGYIIQNGNEDSPYFDHWNTAIVDLAYLKFLEEINRTT